MKSPAATEEIARQALSYRYEDLPGEVVDWARLSLLDHCGLAIRGAREELTQILSNTFLGRGIAGTDMIPGALSGASLQDLAMLRASSAHAIDFDDTLLSAMGAHVGSTVNSALLTLAAQTPVSGKAYLEALVAGYETTARIASLVTLDHYEEGFHSTSSMGVFGVAAACAKLLGADQETLQRALGLAATQACGVKAVFGTMTKPFNAGRCSANGILAGRLAMQGFTCTTDAIESDKGFTQLFKGKPAQEWNLAPENTYLITRNAYKAHAACHATHAMIEGINRLKAENDFALEDVDQVELLVDPLSLKTASIGEPATGLECKFSFAQVAAFALTGRDTASDATYADSILQDEQVNAARGLVRVCSTDQLGSGATGIRIALRSGRTLDNTTSLSEVALGDRARVAEGIRNKFHAAIGTELSTAEAQQMESAIMDIASAPNVIDALAAPGLKP